MGSGKGWAVGVLASLALSLSPSSAWSWTLDFVAPGLKLTTFVIEKVEYDTNLFFEPSNGKKDGVSRTIPGFLLEYSVDSLVLTLGYKIEQLAYFKFHELDTTHQAGLLDALYESPAGLRLELKEDYLLTSDPQNVEQRSRRESMTNRVRGEAEYRLLDRWSLGAGYENTRISYAEERTATEEPLSTLSRFENVASVTGFWHFQPKTSLLVRYSFGRVDFDDEAGRNVTRHVIETGLRGDLTPRLSTTFRLGFEDRQPRSESIKGYRGVIAGGDWTFALLERTRLILALDRRAAESFSADNAFYLTSSGTFTARHELNPKIKASVNARLGQVDYLNKSEDASGIWKWRADLYVGGGAGVTYDIQRWLQVGADYSYARRQSNFHESGYDVHRFGGSLTLQF